MMKEYLGMEFPDWLFVSSEKKSCNFPFIQQTFVQYIPSVRHCDRCWEYKLIYDYYLSSEKSEGGKHVEK